MAPSLSIDSGPPALTNGTTPIVFTTDGSAECSIDGLALDLIENDIAIVRGGMSRQIHAVGSARMVLARE